MKIDEQNLGKLGHYQISISVFSLSTGMSSCWPPNLISHSFMTFGRGYCVTIFSSFSLTQIIRLISKDKPGFWVTVGSHSFKTRDLL